VDLGHQLPIDGVQPLGTIGVTTKCHRSSARSGSSSVSHINHAFAHCARRCSRGANGREIFPVLVRNSSADSI
jgi:hypothetical protein